MRRTPTVWVANHGTEALITRYDGEDIVVEAGQVEEMEVDCAKLCLGLGEENKARVIARLGWAQDPRWYENAMRRLNSFTFHATRDEALKQVRSPAPADSETPAGAKAPAGAVARVKAENNLLQKLAQTAAGAHSAG